MRVAIIAKSEDELQMAVNELNKIKKYDRDIFFKNKINRNLWKNKTGQTKRKEKL